MKKKILSATLEIGLVVSLLGCGNNEQDKNVVSTDVEFSVTENVENQSEEMETVKTEVEVTVSKDKAEMQYNTDDFEEQKDIFIVKRIDTGDGTEIDFTNQEIINGPFTLGESIDIYSFYFTYAGYTKPNIKIGDVWKVDEWIVVPFAQSSFLVKEEDFNRVATLKEKKSSTMEDAVNAENVSATMKQNTASQEKETSGEVASVSEPVAPKEETLAPAPVTTYSEAEVISIVETALRNAGFRKPEEDMTAEELAMFGPTDGMGWGIEDISMTDPYGDAAGTVEGLQFGEDKYYYIESLGSSNGYVHLKLYSG